MERDKKLPLKINLGGYFCTESLQLRTLDVIIIIEQLINSIFVLHSDDLSSFEIYQGQQHKRNGKLEKPIEYDISTP